MAEVADQKSEGEAESESENEEHHSAKDSSDSDDSDEGPDPTPVKRKKPRKRKLDDFIDREAEESEDEEQQHSPAASDVEDRAAVPSKKKKVQKRKRAISSSDEEDEEEEDQEAIRKEMAGFVVDEEEEPEGVEEDKGSEEESSDEGDDIAEEDIELVEENLGIRRPKRRGRLRISESEDEETGARHDKEAVERALFAGAEEEEEAEGAERRPEPTAAPDIDLEESEDEEEDEFDDFIVREPGEEPARRRKKKRRGQRPAGVSDSAIEEAREIFGIDFDDFMAEEDEDVDAELEEEEADDFIEDEGGVRTAARRRRKRRPKRTLLDEMEPAEIARGFLSEADKQVQMEDKPERFMLRTSPVCKFGCEQVNESGNVLDPGDHPADEAWWIFDNAFAHPLISRHDLDRDEMEKQQLRMTERDKNVAKIEQALKFIRNDSFEVPFIAFYRKEYVEPELTIVDLWKIYNFDEKWCQMRQRRRKLIELFERMRRYQNEGREGRSRLENEDPDDDDPDPVRPITDEDIQGLSEVQSVEEIQDYYAFFSLYYGREVQEMVAWEFKEKAKAAAAASQTIGEDGEPMQVEPEPMVQPYKQAARRDAYSLCVKNGLTGFVNKFGLNPHKFGENLSLLMLELAKDNLDVDFVPMHEVEQHLSLEVGPLELAQRKFLSGDESGPFGTAEAVVSAAKYMHAMQLAREPLVRKLLREKFYKNPELKPAYISVRPTKLGRAEIDENHPVYTKRYLKNKSIGDLEKDDFLYLVKAEQAGLVTIDIHLDPIGQENQKTFFDLVIQHKLYHKDEYSRPVQEWNKLREETLQLCFEEMLYPYFKKELKARLIREAQEVVTIDSCKKLYNKLKVAPYMIEYNANDDDANELKFGIRILGISYGPERDEAAFGALIDANGEVTDYIRIDHLNKRTRARSEDEKRLKLSALSKLKQFIADKKPNAIVLGGENMEAINIQKDLEEACSELEGEGAVPRRIPVELMDTELAKVYAAGRRAQQDFGEYPQRLREAISLARRLQDPLIEFCQLCTPDEEILCLSYHPLQDQLPKDDLLNGLMIEFINRVNEVGVDLNRCLQHPHTAPLLQFVAGLGPRKAAHLLKVLQQNENMIVARRDLIIKCHLGPIVFMNCAGFVKIDTARLTEKTDVYVDLLDGSRVHPETYEWARKMAIDALEYEDSDDVNQAEALEEILEQPEKLKDLDLDAFAQELKRQNFGDKAVTLYDIRAELNHRYKDLRTPYEPPSTEEIFNMLTKETPQTFNVGKIVLARVQRIIRRRPKQEEMDSAQPVRNDETGMWSCPFCFKNDFTELAHVWSHFDQRLCEGFPVGVKVELENGIHGFIKKDHISDKHVDNPEDRVSIGQSLYCRVIKVDIERFSCDLTCRSSDLEDRENQYKRLFYDMNFDYQAEEDDKKADQAAKQQKEKRTYVKRVILHPLFKNISYQEAEKLLNAGDIGEVVIRPSSKGENHLTLSYKVAEYKNENGEIVPIICHVDVKEEDKENAFSLGRRLIINEEEYEDLDEIVARFVQPMTALAKDIQSYKYYWDSQGGRKDLLEAYLQSEKTHNPNRIPYALSATKDLPGKFFLSYLPRAKVVHEYVSIYPDGIRYRRITFSSLNKMVAWFKEHFRDPIPGAATPAPMAPVTGATPALDAQSMIGSVSELRMGRTPGGGGSQWNSMPPVATPQQIPSMAAPLAMQAQQRQMPPPMTPAAGYLQPQQFPTYAQATPLPYGAPSASMHAVAQPMVAPVPSQPFIPAAPAMQPWGAPIPQQPPVAYAQPQPQMVMPAAVQQQLPMRSAGFHQGGNAWADQARNWHNQGPNQGQGGGNQRGGRGRGGGFNRGGGGGGGGFRGGRGSSNGFQYPDQSY